MTEPLKASDDSVKKATGKTKAEWFEILDNAGAATMKHPDIAIFLAHEKGVPDWWCQMITVTYEQARGMRKPGQHADGLFSVSASKTIGVSLPKLYQMFSETNRKKWLDKDINVTTAHENKSIRGSLNDGSKIELGFYSKADTKAMVALENSKLPDQKTAQARKAYWKERFEELAKLLA
jgi:hypothetical protein